jgi:hypothetical protein
VDHSVGRPRSLSVEGLLVAMQVNGLRRHHQATLAEVAWVLDSFTDHQRADLGIKDLRPAQAYDRAEQLFNLLNGALEEGWEVVGGGGITRIDVAWFADRHLEASLEGVPTWSRSVAVDGTDIDTWAKLRGEHLDRESGDTRDSDG